MITRFFNENISNSKENFFDTELGDRYFYSQHSFLKRKPILIVGSGLSVKNVDYRRLPEDFDIMRVNHFYKEDYFYFGRKVTYFAPIGNTGILSYLPLVLCLSIKNIYNIDHYLDFNSIIRKYFAYYIDFYKPINIDIDISRSISNYIKIYRIYNGFFEPNAGHLAIIRALEYGYKDIYIVGIELSDKWEYFYDKEEVKNREGVHNFKANIDLLKYLNSLSGVRMYSISSTSGINSILDLAPIRDSYNYTPIKKSREEILLNDNDLKFIEFIKSDLLSRLNKKDKAYHHIKNGNMLRSLDSIL